jgi:hypothetical protein
MDNSNTKDCFYLCIAIVSMHKEQRNDTEERGRKRGKWKESITCNLKEKRKTVRKYA